MNLLPTTNKLNYWFLLKNWTLSATFLFTHIYTFFRSLYLFVFTCFRFICVTSIFNLTQYKFVVRVVIMVVVQKTKLGISRLFSFQHNLHLAVLLAQEWCCLLDYGLHFLCFRLNNAKKEKIVFKKIMIQSFQQQRQLTVFYN